MQILISRQVARRKTINETLGNQGTSRGSGGVTKGSGKATKGKKDKPPPHFKPELAPTLNGLPEVAELSSKVSKLSTEAIGPGKIAVSQSLKKDFHDLSHADFEAKHRQGDLLVRHEELALARSKLFCTKTALQKAMIALGDGQKLKQDEISAIRDKAVASAMPYYGKKQKKGPAPGRGGKKRSKSSEGPDPSMKRRSVSRERSSISPYQHPYKVGPY